ncbi:class I SAM-dependent methyltransferase [uncultured Desulfobacter sp.]|uniref:class I SAM-dependent methyltransferase n=1 Tax=uncultured Desulfobacter sp. TaxID=240139 RepID=UPI003748378C
MQRSDSIEHHWPSGSFKHLLQKAGIQNWKRQQRNKAGIRIPDSLSFVPMDFETQSLTDQLKTAGFKTDEATFP